MQCSEYSVCLEIFLIIEQSILHADRGSLLIVLFIVPIHGPTRTMTSGNRWFDNSTYTAIGFE